MFDLNKAMIANIIITRYQKQNKKWKKDSKKEKKDQLFQSNGVFKAPMIFILMLIPMIFMLTQLIFMLIFDANDIEIDTDDIEYFKF